MADIFWIRTKALLKAHKMSQIRFAEYIDVPIHTFWGWIKKDRIPDARTACFIAQALGTTVEYLVQGTDDINAEDRMHRTSERKSATKEIKKLARRIKTETKRLR